MTHSKEADKSQINCLIFVVPDGLIGKKKSKQFAIMCHCTIRYSHFHKIKYNDTERLDKTVMRFLLDSLLTYA